MKSKSIICICAISFVIIMVSGCGKDYFFEYNCNWQCDDPYIYIDIEHYKVTYTENGEETSVHAAWAHDGTAILFLDDSDAITRTMPASVKDGKLHISNLIKKGDEYVLNQVN